MRALPLVRSAVLALGIVGSMVAADSYPPSDSNTRPMYGVEMSPVPLNVQTQQGLAVQEGVYVRQVFPGTAAAAAGVQPGDVILSVNGAPITGMNSLRTEVGSSNVGDPVRVIVARNGQRMNVESELREWPSNIPFDRIDTEAERRFRDWQARRLARSQGDVQGLADRIAETNRALDERARKPGVGFTDAPAVQQALAMARWMPAWTMTYRWDTAGIAPVGGALAPAEPVGGEPWQLRVKLDAAKTAMARVVEL